MKILEKMARAICRSRICGDDIVLDTDMTMNQYVDFMYIDFINVAQAALYAAGVLILPHDAEPIKGDTIEYDESVKMRDGSVKTIKQAQVVIGLWYDFERWKKKKYTGYKIVSRLGYSAVIHERKELPVVNLNNSSN